MNYASRALARLAVLLPGEEESLLGLYALLVLAKGEDVTLEDVHDAWSLWRVLGGWEYATVKSSEKKETPYLVPFAQLTAEIAGYDQKYADAIRQAARELV